MKSRVGPATGLNALERNRNTTPQLSILLLVAIPTEFCGFIMCVCVCVCVCHYCSTQIVPVYTSHYLSVTSQHGSVYNKLSSSDSHNKTEIFDDRPDILHVRHCSDENF